ncbi:signal recognition particle-docking protein FtsY [Allorhizobium taibaishanense]|uniref:Signal recognition particle receptor FtsY n=1 Tax=Allorhizobium taibaishanense TaxID=887144 RepID=A0A1Q9A1T9_9HYPH|nr:signal recognition particle-docking protein FtsY [Allorhizobium taibaishanense]MBB4009150.1 fused signal recognition particle receptor [Allorhizobium taibaishanense]OLP48562.1 signal recognition particle-docking protein FtsY [Allorhizobium taibaishanense]
MALGFIKKVFTFGKEKPAADEAQPQADAVLSPEEQAAIAAETEPHARVEDLPVADDPVLAEEMETAGGPADDVPAHETIDDEEDLTAEDLSLVPLSLLEAEEEAQEEETDLPPSFDALLEEAEEAAPGSEVALPKGFSTAVFVEPEPEAPEEKQSWFQRLKAGLFRTSSQLTGQIAALFTKRKLDEQTLEELEDLLIQADLGVETAMRVTGTLSSERYGKDVTGEDVTRIMAAEIVKVLKPVAKPLALDLNHKPHVILVVGVNGTGKTTTIGKLAAKLSGSGLKVMLAAGDTFRAAAIEQLKIWADRTGSTFIGTKLGADAAGLAYDAFEKARAEKSDVLIIDTAGRLQNKTELMAELEKIVRVLSKLDPDAPHTVLQTLDATTGQNAMNQVEIFRNVAGVNGLIMTKLDGTARGGILVAIAAKHKLPVYFIGVGEGVDDLEPFEAEDFARAIAGFGP